MESVNTTVFEHNTEVPQGPLKAPDQATVWDGLGVRAHWSYQPLHVPTPAHFARTKRYKQYDTLHFKMLFFSTNNGQILHRVPRWLQSLSTVFGSKVVSECLLVPGPKHTAVPFVWYDILIAACYLQMSCWLLKWNVNYSKDLIVRCLATL